MSKELVSITRTINDLEIYVDDEVAEDEIEVDYFLPRNKHRITVRLKTKDVLPELWARLQQDHK
jgi:hypothetical protein